MAAVNVADVDMTAVNVWFKLYFFVYTCAK